jgi:hypothetical protein
LVLIAPGRLALAQSDPTDSLFSPSLSDPDRVQRFGNPAKPAKSGKSPASNNEPVGQTPPRAAGETGFESTKAKKKIEKPKAGAPRPLPFDPLPPPGVPQQASGRPVAPQFGDRAGYSEVYRPAEALPRRSLGPATDPFDPTGIRVGSFFLRPMLDVTRGFDTNPGRVTGGQASSFTLIEPSLLARSNWSRHEVTATLRGSYSEFDTQPQLNRPLLDLKTNARIDVLRTTAINLEARYLLSTDYPGSPNLPVDIAKAPIFTTTGGTVGMTQRFNRLELSGKGTIDRTVWQDSLLTDGSMSSNEDRNYNQYGVQARAGYEISPGLKPFVQVDADTRQHDIAVDRNGFRRDSDAWTPRIGTTFEITRILTGEASVGYLDRQYQDPNLPALRGVVADASLKWEATALTTAILTASSRGDEVVVSGVSGALRRDLGLQVDHAFRRWLIATVKFGYGFDEYIGDGREDRRMTTGLAVLYKMNRDIWLRGEYRYDQLRSNVSGADYDANVFMLGVKLQR